VNQKQSDANKVKVKIGLAEKYERLAKVTSSRPKREHYMHNAQNYRRQAALLAQ
jgi:hypothetical protein